MFIFFFRQTTVTLHETCFWQLAWYEYKIRLKENIWLVWKDMHKWLSDESKCCDISHLFIYWNIKNSLGHVSCLLKNWNKNGHYSHSVEYIYLSNLFKLC